MATPSIAMQCSPERSFAYPVNYFLFYGTTSGEVTKEDVLTILNSNERVRGILTRKDVSPIRRHEDTYDSSGVFSKAIEGVNKALYLLGYITVKDLEYIEERDWAIDSPWKWDVYSKKTEKALAKFQLDNNLLQGTSCSDKTNDQCAGKMIGEATLTKLISELNNCKKNSAISKKN